MFGVSSALLTSVPAGVDPVPSTNKVFEPSETFVPITLPNGKKTDALAKQSRRPMELELPWEVLPGDCFGITDDYLVYGSRQHEFVVLIDFWPAW